MGIIRGLLNKIKTKFWTHYALRKVKQKGVNIKVNGPTYFTNKTVLGNNTHFNGFKVIGSGLCRIGDNFHSGSGCIVMTHYHNYESGSKIPYDNSYIVKDVEIGDNVWFGLNVIVLPGVKIGEGCVVQAGSVVVSDLPPLSIAGGHPAKVFKYRNEERYFDLKNEKKFF
ncbi:acyltransferase [Algoriphagus confluentis]|uniref:Acyltransferase n=1 Tax=Algoriphagus confluentis TaxID=1697556 RepID=A0ABQ6PIR6_9BACT|nr:hypothetical protein Aconfl_04030 [Algoriphagus confluentis]